MISFAALAQTKGDKLTINLKNGTSQVWDLTADGQTPVSKITHSADGKVGFVMTGLEDIGAFETYDINDINNISFSIYHESEVGDVNLADPAATEKDQASLQISAAELWQQDHLFGHRQRQLEHPRGR